MRTYSFLQVLIELIQFAITEAAPLPPQLTAYLLEIVQVLPTTHAPLKTLTLSGCVADCAAYRRSAKRTHPFGPGRRNLAGKTVIQARSASSCDLHRTHVISTARTHQ
jgi:hypothetical protein